MAIGYLIFEPLNWSVLIKAWCSLHVMVHLGRLRIRIPMRLELSISSWYCVKCLTNNRKCPPTAGHVHIHVCITHLADLG